MSITSITVIMDTQTNEERIAISLLMLKAFMYGVDIFNKTK